ncbi:hypothetical protein K2173_001443 [Erythroxylum novogranatense]|uniref:Reticulon-like protein n=1 Tax=Erythroxylum novogranatense TaxID=1862640 RepID=A0AAV8TAS7_9ROSI|nr:hypothetical protein K2173_001443 [Erythroxylum novogranatense]
MDLLSYLDIQGFKLWTAGYTAIARNVAAIADCRNIPDRNCSIVTAVVVAECNLKLCLEYLNASELLLSRNYRYNDLGQDGGPAAKELMAKLAVAKKHMSSNLVETIPDIDPRLLVMAIIVQKGLGGLLFIFGSLSGAYLLLLNLLVTSPILYDFYNYGRDGHEYSTLLNEFLQNVALLVHCFTS